MADSSTQLKATPALPRVLPEPLTLPSTLETYPGLALSQPSLPLACPTHCWPEPSLLDVVTQLRALVCVMSLAPEPPTNTPPGWGPALNNALNSAFSSEILE